MTAALSPRRGTADRFVVPCDRELLDCIARGWTRKEIAAEYCKPLKGIETQAGRLVKRMRAKSLEHAVYMFATRPSFDERGYWVNPVKTL